ncbi:hypothetical protein [Psychrobacter sp. I-STPA10]|uniref:hypothetical protein n=1 Tax=Psychrobacter sp. I-STPA10 TaxID=2585769 RepID=UPI001E323C7A|nr:hypothetical protein [Psychrobacter sp. I-STPA10]
MNLFLIGFSEQNAAAIKMLCKRNFQSIHGFSIQRQFSGQMHLTLPQRSQIKVTVDAFMVDLEGVGMTQYSTQFQSDLLKFIETNPTVLVSRRDLRDWQVLTQQTNTPILYLSVPYSMHDMNDMLQKIRNYNVMPAQSLRNQLSRSTVASMPEANANVSQTHSHICTHKQSVISTAINHRSFIHDKTSHISRRRKDDLLPSTVSASLQTQVAHVVKKSRPNVKIIDGVLKQYFTPVYDTIFVQTVLSVFAQNQPMILQVNKYELLINPTERSVFMGADIARVIDYFCIVGGYQYALSTTNHIRVIPISETQYKQKSQQLSLSGHKKLALSTVFWQLAAEIDFKEIPRSASCLQLKVKYIPNFAMMRFVPSYVYPVLAACLNKVRTLAQLQVLFPEISLQQLNHLILLCILSGVADESVLVAETQQIIDFTKKIADEKPKNTDIRQANRTGFFKRLLQKLSI